MIRPTAAALLATALLAAAGARAGDFYETGGAAIGGYDPVAYFTQHTAVPGLPQFTASYGGSTFRFASAADRDQFTSDPDKYAPRYHGYCTFGVAEGAKVASNPAAYRIVDGKLYLQFSPAVTKRFDQDPAKYLREAEANWPTVQNKPLEK